MCQKAKSKDSAGDLLPSAPSVLRPCYLTVPFVYSISDLQQIKLMSNIGVDDATRGNFVSAFGVCMVAGGKLCGTSIKHFGPRGHTTINNILTILSVSDDRTSATTCTYCGYAVYQESACTPSFRAAASVRAQYASLLLLVFNSLQSLVSRRI